MPRIWLHGDSWVVAMNLKAVGSQVMILVLTITNLKCPMADLGGRAQGGCSLPLLATSRNTEASTYSRTSIILIPLFEPLLILTLL